MSKASVVKLVYLMSKAMAVGLVYLMSKAHAYEKLSEPID